MPALKDLTTQFPEDIRFKFPWRKYQQRVLDDLQGHLDDRHLHIIAPPGSGKTILRLEVQEDSISLPSSSPHHGY